MTTHDDGGLAYPQTWHPDMGWSARETPTGMTLLDHFAGQALQGILAAGANPDCGDTANWDKDATCGEAYRWAAALVAEKRRREARAGEGGV